jgi:outer membrane lipoprotein-sorting protein
MARWHKARGGILIFFLGIFAANGCVKKPPLPPKAIITSAPAIIQILEDRKKIIHDLKAIAHISLASPERKFSAKQAIVLRKPHYLRIETLSFFGYPILYLFADGTQISFYNPKENRLFKGSPRLDNIFRLTGIPLEISEIVAILCGDVPLKSNITRAELRFEPENTLYSLQLWPNEEIKLGAVDLLPRRYRLAERSGGKDKTYIEVIYQKYKKINEIFFPFNIQIKLPQTDITVRIKYSEVKFNQAIPDTSFQLPRLEGVEVIDLDGGWPYEKR